MTKLQQLTALLEDLYWVHPDAANYFPSNVNFKDGKKKRKSKRRVKRGNS